MQTMGLLGGMSWESTLAYYRLANRLVGERLGGLHSARLLLYSVDFEDVEILQREERWDEAGRLLAGAGAALERAGADFLVLCTNTMHEVAPAIEDAVGIPLLHIADATGEAIREAGVSAVGLLGTRYTMERDFYRGRLAARHGLRVVVPGEPDRETVHRVIYEELCRGTIRPESRERFRGIMTELAARGAEGIVLGCTEISLLVGPGDAPVPLFDTTEIHVRRAVDRALGSPAGAAPGGNA